MYGCARVEVGVEVVVLCLGEWGLDACAREAVVVSVSVLGMGVGGVWVGEGNILRVYLNDPHVHTRFLATTKNRNKNTQRKVSVS